MTREEAIALLNEQYETCKRIYDCSADQRKSYPNVPQFMEALDMALTALRPVRREQIKKMKKEPVEGEYDELYAPTYKCPECGFENIGKGNFCQNCGCLYTDEAVQMVMERLEATYEQDND